ncbi:hypothetical protein HAQ00_10010 [Acidithiobacillus caldus ATCC 51756]|uniref:thermostable hemolysin n=1 Tax=Acidithiobacillus caldus TaxID=33059 RepID=UPI001C06C2B0|nr:thermostable hemolysin [Acidithiobacillus caldus]MBU2736048.1 hypothetical protein [Acidithiobacillus caldus ATCC 51756]MBU2801753.1 hypothetical protein [Acidithiobacillus caldus]
MADTDEKWAYSIDNDVDMVVEIARSETDIEEAMEFCGKMYVSSYGTRWAVAPDVLFVARQNGKVVGTGGLEIGGHHSHIGAEKYFCLSPRMIDFISSNRQNIAEFGRFSSSHRKAGQVIFCSAIDYLEKNRFTYLFAWANPSIYSHVASRIGVPFWVVDVPINKESVYNDSDWIKPPVGFFIREDPPKLLISILPFWDFVKVGLQHKTRYIVRNNELPLAVV